VGAALAATFFARARYRVRALAKPHSASLPRSDRSPLALASCVAALRTTLVRAHRYRAPATRRLCGRVKIVAAKAAPTILKTFALASVAAKAAPTILKTFALASVAAKAAPTILKTFALASVAAKAAPTSSLKLPREVAPTVLFQCR